MEAEGWYRDPYLVHEDRWFSAGQPTKLVRDAGIEDYDPLRPARQRRNSSRSRIQSPATAPTCGAPMTPRQAVSEPNTTPQRWPGLTPDPGATDPPKSWP